MRKTVEKISKTTWVLYIIIAIGLLLAGAYFGQSNWQEKHPLACGIISTVCITFGSVVLTAAVGSILFKTTGLFEVIKLQIAGIMANSEFIDYLAIDKLKKVKSNIDEKIYTKEINSDDFLKHSVEASIVPLYEKPFFQRYQMAVSAHIDKKKRVLEKRYVRRMLIKGHENTSSHMNYEDILTIGFDIPKDFREKNGSLANLTKFVVCGENVTPCFELKETDDPSQKNEDFIRCIYKLQCKDFKMVKNCKVLKPSGLNIQEEPVSVFLDVDTITMDDDILMIHKIYLACKWYEVTFYHDDTIPVVEGYPFGFLDYRENEIYSKSNVTKNSKTITFDGWILPGDGSCFAIVK